VMSKLRGTGAGDIPPYVSLRGMSRGTEPGYLGVAHRPFTPDGDGVRNLRLAGGVNTTRMDDRKSLLANFDDVRRDIDATGTMKGIDSFTARAFDMIASGTVRKALDLTKEDPRSRDRYKGIEQFLMARRLVESGVGCVTLSIGGWDTHSGNFKSMRKQLPQVDRGIANLIQDLHDRGMENDVVTVMWGEFGRTPKINNSDGGRDHWAPVMSALVAGGGLKMGQAIGATSGRGEYPKDRRYTVPQVLATLYQAMGIDPTNAEIAKQLNVPEQDVQDMDLRLASSEKSLRLDFRAHPVRHGWSDDDEGLVDAREVSRRPTRFYNADGEIEVWRSQRCTSGRIRGPAAMQRRADAEDLRVRPGYQPPGSEWLR